jgi:hypothetical protein
MVDTTPSHFIVSMQDAAWQFSHRGTVTGPFPSKEEAIDAAVEEAKAITVDGDPSEVIVENEDRTFESTWRAEGLAPADFSIKA